MPVSEIELTVDDSSFRNEALEFNRIFFAIGAEDGVDVVEDAVGSNESTKFDEVDLEDLVFRSQA